MTQPELETIANTLMTSKDGSWTTASPRTRSARLIDRVLNSLGEAKFDIQSGRAESIAGVGVGVVALS